VAFRGGPDRRRFMRRTFGDRLFAEDERGLERVVGEALIASRRTLAVAESCTGGLVTDLLTDVPGISTVLLEGTVTYSNASKASRLGVAVVRAVSEETAVGMARGAAESAGAQLGLSTTGVAGPGGHPVGLVWVAAWDGRAHTRRLQLRGDRRRIKTLAAMHALDLLRQTI
jgi:nicotinamide-nucleotide amidase